MSLNFNFEGKVALITGSSSGIGAATAVLFAKSGANVVVTGLNADDVKDVSKQCRQISENKSRVLGVVADITIEEDCKRLVNETIQTFGKLDILVNNAGASKMATITDSDFMEKYKNIIDLNLNSVVLLTHLSVEHLEKTKGNIINISSIGALKGVHMPGTTCYSTAKAAMDMFTRCMAAELGSKGIRVNVINPGAVKTNFVIALGMNKTTRDTLYDSIAQKLPLGRFGEGEDIANAVLFLASDASAFITGSNLVSDGGNVAANAPFN